MCEFPRLCSLLALAGLSTSGPPIQSVFRGAVHLTPIDATSGLRARWDATSCRLQRFAQMKKQLESLDRDTIRQVDSACKEISRNCELLTIIKQDLDSVYRSTRCAPA